MYLYKNHVYKSKFRAQDSWCLYKLIYYKGENAMKYVEIYKWLFLDEITPNLHSKTLN